MAADMGFSRRTSSERDLQPVAIIAVDPLTRTATGVTRTRHTLRINCAYATGDTITIPAAGEQWYCERFEMEWRLYGRIPFNDPTLNIKPEEGQVSVGSASGPLELNGTEVRANGAVFRLNGVYYRDSGTALERSTDQQTWTPIVPGDVAGILQVVAKTLADFTGSTEAGAITALTEWGDTVDEVLRNFGLFWDLICGNVFVSGLRRLGVGDTEVAKIVDGFQNFVNYLFGIVFCDFTGDLTPQTLLARLRDLLAPIINNPFVQGLQKIAEILGVAVGNLLNDAVAGLTSLIELIFNIITCNWTALADQLTAIFRIIDEADGDNPFGPANIIKSLFNLFQLLGSPEIAGIPNPIGIFVIALQNFFKVLFESTGNLLEDALGGLVQFVSLIFGILTCDADALTKAQQVIDAITGDGSIFDNIVKTLFGVLTPLTQTEIAGIPNPVGIFLAGLKDFYEAVSGNTATNLADGAIGGAVEFVRLIFRVISCSDTNVLADLTSLVDSFTSGYDDPFGILKFLGDLFTSILSNPLVIAIQDFLVGFFPDLAGTSLIQQLIDGGSNLVHLLIKVVTSILPFRDLWETLLPFVDWNKVDEMEAVLPDLTGFFLNGLEDLWKMIFKPIDLIIQGIIPAAGDTAFTDFIENLINFFSGNGLLSSFFTDPGAFDLQKLANEFMQNVLGLLTLDENGLLKIVTDFVPTVVGDFLANLLALFGVDFNVNAEDFDPATALPTVATAIAQGIFGQAAATVKTIFDRLVGLFGGSSVFTGGTFDITALATYFTNNVLNLATSALQALVEGAGSLVYQIANGIIEAIRGFPFGLGVGLANTLQTLLNGFVNFGRGTVKSGSNLLSDPGAEVAAFWVQADATRDTTIKRSAGASLRVTSGGATARTFWFNVDDLGAVASIDTDTGEVNYAECYVLYPITVSGATNAGTSGTVTLVARYYDSTGAVSTTPELTATASMNKNNTTWVKLSGNFTTPTTGVPDTQYDRVDFGFRLVGGQTTSGARFYVDDMLVREISEAAATNQNLYGNASRPSSSTQLREPVVPSGISSTKILGTSGTGNIGTEVGGLNTAVGSTGNGTGLSGTVYGTNGQGGLVGFGGTTTTVTNTYNNVFGTSGLIPRLYGTGATSPGTTIQTAALPPAVKYNIGSGATSSRTVSGASTNLRPGTYRLSQWFNVTTADTPDVTRTLVSGYPGGLVGYRMLNAGWYMVSLCYGLNADLRANAFSPYAFNWNVAPALFTGTVSAATTTLAQVGPDVIHANFGVNINGAYGWGSRTAQANFIVYCEENTYIVPGVSIFASGASTESQWTTGAPLLYADGTGSDNYFNISLLNRSLA